MVPAMNSLIRLPNPSPLRRGAAFGCCARAAGGFTLIEAMMTMGLLAIVLALAVPSYSAYMIRTQRTEALQELLTMAACQERVFARTNAYDADACAGDASSSRYAFSTATSNNNQDFVATAVPQGGQVDDECGTLSINQVGVKTAGGEGGSFAATCWKGK